MIVQHEYFRKNLEKVTIQEFVNPFSSKTAKSEDFIKPLQPLGSAKEVDFQRAFKDSPDLKFARSDLFWPDTKPELKTQQDKFTDLGLEVLDLKESQTYRGDLINSMVFFEQLRFDPSRVLAPQSNLQKLKDFLR